MGRANIARFYRIELFPWSVIKFTRKLSTLPVFLLSHNYRLCNYIVSVGEVGQLHHSSVSQIE